MLLVFAVILPRNSAIPQVIGHKNSRMDHENTESQRGWNWREVIQDSIQAHPERSLSATVHRRQQDDDYQTQRLPQSYKEDSILTMSYWPSQEQRHKRLETWHPFQNCVFSSGDLHEILLAEAENDLVTHRCNDFSDVISRFFVVMETEEGVKRGSLTHLAWVRNRNKQIGGK